MKPPPLLGFLFIPFLGFGCISPGTNSYIAPMDQPTGASGYLTPDAGRSSFGPGQVPTIIITKYPGKSVNIKLYDGNGNLYAQDTKVMPANENFTQMNAGSLFYPDLPNGSYTAMISVDGFVRETLKFSVSR